MSFGYSGGAGNQLGAEDLIPPEPRPRTTPNKEANHKAAKDRYAARKVVENRASKANFKRVAEATAESAVKTVEHILTEDQKTAKIAGQMVTGMLQVGLNPTAKLNCVTGHPQFRYIETELILTRGADFENICKKYDIRNKSGALAVGHLAAHYGKMRQRYSRLFETLDQEAGKRIASSYIEKINEIYDLAKETRLQAVTKRTYVPSIQDFVENPDFEAAAMMLDKMIAATNLLGAAMERQKKEEAQPDQRQTVINGPVGRVQILALPKAVPPRPALEAPKSA